VEVHEFCAQALVAAPETSAYLPSERCCFYASLPCCAPVEGAVTPQPGGLPSEGGGRYRGRSQQIREHAPGRHPTVFIYALLGGFQNASTAGSVCGGRGYLNYSKLPISRIAKAWNNEAHII
jgi:hypothetical protein